jgi:leucine dehydrogenase
VLDDLTLGPGVGGIRTHPYGSLREGVVAAARLARAMTVKSALAGLDAGGAKAVVLDHAGLDRERAFEVLGERIEELAGLFRTAGDLGTTASDLAAVARTTRYVHTETETLSEAVAHGLVRCMEACVRAREAAPIVEAAPVVGAGDGAQVPGSHEGRPPTLAGLRVAVEGCGVIGAAVAEELARAGATVLVADLDEGRARSVARDSGATVVPPAALWEAEVDIVAPCAMGGTVTERRASEVRAWAVCGAANNQLASEAVAEVLRGRDVLFVPDVIASAGAVIEGIGRTVMKLDDRTGLIDRLGETAFVVLSRAMAEHRSATGVAYELAEQRLRHAATRPGAAP